MGTKLTLVMEEAVIKAAKGYARRRHSSLSKIVEQYFSLISAGDNHHSSKAPRRGSLTSSLVGAVRTKHSKDLDKSAKELIREAKAERFG